MDHLPPLDIISFLRTATILLILGMLLSIRAGIKKLRTAKDIPYYKMRRQHLERGWRQILLGILLIGIGIVVWLFGEPAAYQLVEITGTPSITASPSVVPSSTPVPSATLTPTISLTPAESYTPTVTPTPYVPLAIEAQFSAQVTPPAKAVFTELTFAQGFNEKYRPINPNTVFKNPVGHLYGLFSYDQMADGVQWTALWFRNGELVYYETQVWQSGTGGFGFTDWDPDPNEWLPGDYQVQIFLGTDFMVLSDFRIEGNPVTSTPTRTETSTPTMTFTPSKTPTITNTATRTVTITTWPTNTRTATTTSWPTITHASTQTPWPTQTRTPAP
jgi:hypothetical protein